MLDFELGRSNLDEFAATLLALAEKDRQIIVVTCDSRGSAKLTHFTEVLPNQTVEMGIAEQNMVGVSAGLASTGKKVFSVTPASFLTARSFEQIKNDVAYSDQPVKLVGISAGVSYGALGYTHHSTHDYAALQALYNIAIISPADNFETREAVRAVVNYPHPVYLRFGKKSTFNLPRKDGRFQIGKARILEVGTDLTFIATGETVAEAFRASLALKEQGVNCGVISLHTLRPFDGEAVLQAANASKALITVEEHSVNGGLGSTVASFLMKRGIYRPMQIIGIPDEEMITGSQEEIYRHYGIDSTGLMNAAIQMVQANKVGI